MISEIRLDKEYSLLYMLGDSNKSIFASKITDEELSEGVTYLTKSDTGLPCDIIVDCGKTYEYYNHPLCLYVVQGEDVIPVLISKDTRNNNSFVSPEVLNFIKTNYKYLKMFANNRIGAPRFFERIEKY